MLGCHGCQDLLLDYLYDLLDEADQVTFQAHLTGCPACQAALEKARAQQKLLARAARKQFPDVHFVAPHDEHPAAGGDGSCREGSGVTPLPVTVAAEPVRPVVLAIRPRRHRAVRWARWAAAAAVLVAATGVGIPAYHAAREYADARQTVERQNAALVSAHEEMQQAQESLRKAAADRQKQVAQISHEMRARELRLVVSGPRSVQPGAPAEYLIQAFDLNGQPARADVSARLGQVAQTEARMPGSGTGASADTARPVQTGGKEGKDELAVRSEGEGTYRVSIPVSVGWTPGQAVDMLVTAKKAGDGREQQPVTLEGKVQLTAPVYLTHLTTDKPMYQHGETVFFRSLTLDRATLRPAEQEFRLHYTLTNPRGAVTSVLRGSSRLYRAEGKDQVKELLGPDGKPVRGIGAGELFLEPGIPGGEYTLTVTEEHNRFLPVTRKFTVNEYRKPSLDKKLDFNRSSYGPGDEVQVRASARRADGGPVSNCPVLVTVNVDDHLYDAAGNLGAPFQARTDVNGEVTVRFRLPKQIERGQGSLSVLFQDTVPEPIVRTIPLVLKKLSVEFYPEGGDLVAGLENRVYFQARTPLGKPAQLRGTLLEDGRPLPGTVATEHDDEQPGVNQGNGAFTFTPRAGRKYELRIDEPAGIAGRKPLPEVHADGVVLSTPKGVFGPNEPLRVKVQNTRKTALMVGAYCRGQLLDTVQVPQGQTEVELRPASGAGGVCRITVFEERDTGRPQRQLRPVAERLVYRHPRERVDVSVEPNKRRYTPGERAELTVVTTDEKEKMRPALAMVAVTDRSVLTVADEKTARTMPTHFLLTTEVRKAEDLEYADFLVGDHRKAARSLDLLLGTQGWRRFAEQDPQQFRERLRKSGEALPEAERLVRQEEGERLLVMTGQSEVRTTDFDQEKLERVNREFATLRKSLASRQAEAAQAVARVKEDEAYRTAAAVVGQYDEWLRQARQLALPVLGASLVLLAILGLGFGLRRETAKAWTWGGLAAVCGLLLLVAWWGPSGPKVAKTSRPDEEAVARLNEEAEEEAPAELQKAVEEKTELLADKAAKPAARATALPPAAAQAPRGGTGFGGAPGMAQPAGPVAGFMGGTARPAAPGGLGGFPFGAPAPVPPPAMKAPGDDLARGETKKKEMVADGRILGRTNRAVRPGRPMAGGKGEAAGGLAYARRKLQLQQLERDRDLAPFHKADAMEGGGAGAKDAEAQGVAAPPLIVREFAHVRPAGDGNTRSDFAETLYWHPVLVLPGGKATVSFPLCDSVTTFQVTVFAHTADGRLGAGTKVIESRLPFTLAPKLPTEVTAGDRIDVPVAVSNNSSSALDVELAAGPHDGLTLLGGAETRLGLAADARTRHVFRYRPSLVDGKASLTFTGKAGTFSDAVRETVRVVPDGFPVQGSSSDLLERSASHRVTLPHWLPGTLTCRVDVYPSTLADLEKGLEGLLREPHGCFEQSSTANYPNVLILDYLRSSDKSNPELERRTRQLLDRGYQKLTSFECQKPGGNARQGYEWFGGTAPPHEALTAYGLLQFRDMARVFDVDGAMVKRTRDYLLGQRDGKGGFKRNPRAIDTFGRAPEHVTNAYVVWALTESGKEDVSRELKALKETAARSDDPYFLSLVAASLANRNEKGEAKSLLEKVAKAQKDDGHLEAKETSITGSGGRDLLVETTALAVLGWLKADALAFDKPIRGAVRWIGQQRGGHGAFGSTQSTILALKALIAWTKANRRTPEAGELRLFVGDEKVADLRFPAGVDRPLTLAVPDAEKKLKPGANRLRVEITGEKNHFPHTLSWTCRTAKPDSAANVPVKLTTTLAASALEEGAAVRLKVRVENVSGKHQGMTVAIVGLPAGLNVPEDLKQLKEHCRLPTDGSRPVVDAFEILGREVVLYWRDMANGRVAEVPLDLVARVPGEYRGPASRAYLYYDADRKHWVEPLSVTVRAK